MPKKMNLLGKLHQEFVVDAISELQQDGASKTPLIVELDTTEACDLACPGCISEDIMKGKRKFSNKRLMELGKEFHLSGVKGVILIGGGEPLAHPAVGDFMDYLGENDIHIGITTNGTFIDRYLDTIAEYSAWTRVSMDAATSQTFGILRPSKGGKSKFDHIVRNMRLLAKRKKGKLGFSYLIQTPKDGPGVISNVKEIYAAAQLAKDIGCDYFEVKPSYQFRDEIDHALMVHDKNQMQEAKEEISRLDELATEDFAVLKAINLDISLSGEQSIQPKKYNWCPATELRTLICPSGAFVCPYWRGKEHMRIGDLRNQSFDEVWNGALRQQVSEKLNPGVDCSFHCLRHESNLNVLEMMKSIKDGESVDIVDEFDRFI